MRTMRPRVTLQLPSRPLIPHSPSKLAGLTLLLIGEGYVVSVGGRWHELGLKVVATKRADQTEPQYVGDERLLFGSDAMREAFATADLVIVSVPPGRDDPEPTLAALQGVESRARWIGYLSATSVYGDRAGGWAFEGEAPTPSLRRGKRRADAELAWLEAYPQTHIFRLAGIYGPGRVPWPKIWDGTARVVTGVPDHVVNRIHVKDIVSALVASMCAPCPGDIYNIADGHPARPGDVIAFAAELTDFPPPPRVPLNDPSVSAMARSFYAETKRIDISRARERLGWEPSFPDYRSGLKQLMWELMR